MNPNTRDIHGKTPLYYAVEGGYRDCVIELLNCKADPELPVDDDEQKAVHLAAGANNKNILKILLEYGAKKDEKDKNGKGPIDIALEKNYPNILDLLLEYKVSLERCNCYLNTPMHTIAIYASCRCADYLLKCAKIDLAFEQLNARNVDKETPIDIAKRKGNYTVFFTYIEMVHKNYFESNPTIYHDLMTTGQHEILMMIFDRMCEENDKNTEVHCTAILLDINEEGNSPFSENFSHLLPSLLHKLLDCEDKGLREHPIVKKTVEKKLNFYRIWYTFTLFLYCVFMIILSVALYVASYECESRQINVRNSMLASDRRIFLDISVFAFVIVLTFSELVEFVYGWSRIIKSQKFKQLNNETDEDNFKEQNSLQQIFEQGKKVSKLILLFDRALFNFPRAILQYLADSFLDVLGIVSLLLYYIIRLMHPNTAWLFASLAYIAFIISLLKYTRIISSLGAYIDTVKAVFSKDIPRFLVLYLIVLAAFIGGLHLAARFHTMHRTTLKHKGLQDIICPNDTTHILYFNEDLTEDYTLLKPLVTGLILLLDGGPGNREDDILKVNPYFAIIYLLFSFIIIVVLSNILIAQLSETYAALSEQGTFYYSLGLIVTMELESSIGFFLGKYLRRLTSIRTFKVPKDEWKTLLNEKTESKSNNGFKLLEEKINYNIIAVKEGNEKALTIMEYLAPMGEKIEDMQKDIDEILNGTVETPGSEQPRQKEILRKIEIGEKIEMLESKLGAQNAAFELKLNQILEMLKIN